MLPVSLYLCRLALALFCFLLGLLRLCISVSAWISLRHALPLAVSTLHCLLPICVQTMNTVSKPRTTNPKAGRDATNIGRWTKMEHQAFVEGLQLYGREWKKVAKLVRPSVRPSVPRLHLPFLALSLFLPFPSCQHPLTPPSLRRGAQIPTRTVVQIRTHAQKYFQKLAKEQGVDNPDLAFQRASQGLAPLTSAATTPSSASGKGSAAKPKRARDARETRGSAQPAKRVLIRHQCVVALCAVVFAAAGHLFRACALCPRFFVCQELRPRAPHRHGRPRRLRGRRRCGRHCRRLCGPHRCAGVVHAGAAVPHGVTVPKGTPPHGRTPHSAHVRRRHVAAAKQNLHKPRGRQKHATDPRNRRVAGHHGELCLLVSVVSALHGKPFTRVAPHLPSSGPGLTGDPPPCKPACLPGWPRTAARVPARAPALGLERAPGPAPVLLSVSQSPPCRTCRRHPPATPH